MAQRSFYSYIVIFIVSALTLIGAFDFTTSIGEGYGNEDIMNSDKIDMGALRGNIINASDESDEWQEAFSSDEMQTDSGTMSVTSIWGVSKRVWGAMNSITNVYLKGVKNVLGIDPIFTGAISLLIVLGFMFSVWRLVKTGE